MTVEKLTNSKISNAVGTSVNGRCTIYKPKSAHEIREAINDVGTKNLKAIGSGWAFSEVAISRHSNFIDTANLDKVLFVHNPNGYTKTGISYSPLFQGMINSTIGLNRAFAFVESGIKLRYLIEYLMKFHHLALPTMGGSDGQSLGGAISTGTHGTTFNFGSIADSVVGVHVVGPNGKNMWMQNHHNAPVSIEWLKDSYQNDSICEGQIHIFDQDKFLNASTVSIGRIGFVYGYVIELVPLYFLKSKSTKFSWSDFRKSFRMKKREFPFDYQGPRDFWSSGDLIGKPNRCDGSTYLLPLMKLDGISDDGIWVATNVIDPTPQDIEAIDNLPWNNRGQEKGFPDGNNSVVHQPHPKLSDLEILHKSGAFKINDAGDAFLSIFFPGVREAVQTVDIISRADFLNKIADGALRKGEISYDQWREKIRGYDASKIIESQIMSFYSRVAPGQAEGDYRYMSTGDTSRENYIPFPTIYAEYAADASDYSSILSFVDYIRESAARHLIPGYISIRFTKKTSATIGMQRWPITCHIEMAAPLDFENSTLLFDQIDDMADSKGFIPHWGQRVKSNAREIDNFYDENINKWRDNVGVIYSSIGIGKWDTQRYMCSNKFTLTNAIEPHWMNVTYPLIKFKFDTHIPNIVLPRNWPRF